MLSFLRDKNFIKNNNIVGLHCYALPDGYYVFHYILLSHAKGKFNVEKQESYKGSIEQLTKVIPKNIPIYLSLDGKGVLTKKISADNSKSIIQQVIPNANSDDFCIQQLEGENGMVCVSLARKDFLDNLFEQFTKNNLQIIGLALGEFIATKLCVLFAEFPAEFSTGNYTFTCNKQTGVVEDLKRNDPESPVSEYTFAGQTISSDYILPFYHALTYYTGDINEILYPPVTNLYEEFTYKRLFKLTGWAMLLIIMALLMINMLWFTNLNDKRQNLETQVEGTKTLLARLTILKEEFTWKQKFLEQAGILENTRMSFYADQIASTVPTDISLEKMDIHPLRSKIKKQKEIEIQPDKINIEGIAESSLLVNTWIQELKTKTWIEDVEVVNYTKEDGARLGLFTIDIQVSHNNKPKTK